MKRLGVAAGVLALGIAMPSLGQAQPVPSPSPSPTASAPDASTGGFDVSKLTPAQQEALRLAIIKTSQNPVGNITVVPFQNNFNYGYGPYTRSPIQPQRAAGHPDHALAKHDSDRPHDLPNPQPAFFRASQRLRIADRVPFYVRNRRYSRTVLFCAQNQAGPAHLGRGSDISVSNRLSEHASSGKWSAVPMQSA